jgi:hypothetical protein
MSNAAIWRVRMRDLARRGRFRPLSRPHDGLATGVLFATGERPQGV